jgi:hypothetical protein
MLSRPSETPDAESPATLHGVMQDALAKGLREQFRPVRDVPHDLLVLLMQINEDRHRSAKATKAVKAAKSPREMTIAPSG